MSRTSRRQLKTLLREARLALGVRINRQVWHKLTPFTDAAAERLGEKACAVMITPYTDDCWVIYWIDSQARERKKRFDPDDLRLCPKQFVERYLNSH